MGALGTLAAALRDAPRHSSEGRVVSVAPERVRARGLGAVALGERVRVRSDGNSLLAEVVANDGHTVELACFQSADGLGPGARVITGRTDEFRPSPAWLGRIVDPFGRPLDGRGSLPRGDPLPTRRAAPSAARRAPMGTKMRTGIHALDLFAPLCAGQRIGLFAGSGVGKSVLMGMVAARADADAIVVAMVGERGREVLHFAAGLDPATRARTALMVATSDQSASTRREAAFAATALAESLSATGLHVLLLMDSVTRFAMAGREIGLAAGEPPSVRGYPPSVFAELPRLLERSGPAIGARGPITAVYTVLVEGGDHDEPVADAVRGILDGHVVLTRAIAERGRMPAIDVLKSVSRSLPAAHDDEENRLMIEARRLLADMADVDEIVRLGAYEYGANPRTDRAIALTPAIEELLTQGPAGASLTDPFGALRAILGGPDR